MDLIIQYPELLIANRFELIHLKFKLFRSLDLDQQSIKKFILKYPFVIMKYHS